MRYFNVFVKTDCPFCKKAIKLLTKNEKKFIVTVVDHAEEFRQKIAETTGHPTVPVVLDILEDGSAMLVGGFTELEAMIKREKDNKDGKAEENNQSA